MGIGAIDDKGAPVDWWFIYKVAGRSTKASDRRDGTLNGKKILGTEYLYFDANTPDDGKLALSPHKVDEGGRPAGPGSGPPMAGAG